MVAAQERDTQKRASQCGACDRPLPAQHAEEKQKDQRRPYRAIQHLRPADVAKKSTRAKRRRGQQRRAHAAFQIAQQKITKQRPHVVNQHVIPVQDVLPYPAVAQGHQRQHPIERIGCAGQHCAQHGLAAPFVGIPQGKASGMPLGRLELVPGEDLPGVVLGVVHGVLIGEHQLPVNGNNEQKQQDGSRPADPAPACTQSIALVLFGHLHCQP